ncbi:MULTISPECIES: DinB family protein [unclassified Streptomyces]|uniref:DinB family protein n=1 Tax=unclassified Streptomyces TaxID=2593676 RepID=UPI00381317FB
MDTMLHCTECNYEYDLALADKVSVLTHHYVSEYVELLRADPVVLRRRAAPQLWSPLEYACHMRDVLFVQRERLLAARRSDSPVTEPMGRDERVEHDGYIQQEPADVARQLNDAALLFTHGLDQLGPADWERTLSVPYPETAVRSLRWFAVHTLHELRHHQLDMRRQLEHA